MPRVNRDLQRRLAARRERERRRPTERRYNFATTEPELVDAVEDTELDTTTDADVLETDAADTDERAPASARATRTTAATAARGAPRSTYRPFSDYKEEYAYVTRDLRRVAAVVGGLLVALLVLYFALSILVH
ncbi:MAG TPA: hypothetical protein VGK33_19220 [Chloroflexota bacterium]|jgi:propanediol dehydratase small subunit